MGMAVGVDLGTTNSVVAVKKISLSTLLNKEGGELTPSCVTAVPKATDGTYDLIVGQAARDLMKQYPDQTVSSVKRLIGREFDDIEVQKMREEKKTSYLIETDPSEPGLITIPLGGKNRTPEEISSLVLKKVIGDASLDVNAEIDAAVVTVPAYFSDRQKFATRAACEMAGLRLLRLLPEPTAAAISFGLGEDKEAAKTVMVFDLGGGTFDISVLNVNQGIFMEVAKGGDMWLGGDNIDHLLVDHVYRQVESSGEVSNVRELIDLLPPKDKARFIAEIKEKCELAKIRLSTKDSAPIELFGILRDRQNNLVDIDVSISRAEFDRMIAPLVARLSRMAEQLLHEIRFEPELIDTVLMVGGSSLVPAIQEEVKRLFGAQKVIVHPRPMTAIAEGAAWMASHLAGADHETMTMMHSVAHDYYIQLAGGQKHLLVAKNMPLPFSVEQKFRFATEDQLLARLRVFNEIDGIMETVGELWFHADSETFKKRRHKQEELTLAFSVNEDNIISMEATSVTNPRRKVAGQIARGGMVTKLYADLEKTLSGAIASCKSETGSLDTLELSERIVPGILESTDPRTGATRPEKKQMVQKQIATLGELLKDVDAPLAKLEFAESALKTALPVLAPDQEAELKTLTADLQNELASLLDTRRMNDLFEQLQDFWKRTPATATLTRMQDFLESAGKSDLAQSLTTKMQRYITAFEEQNQDDMKRIETMFQMEVAVHFNLNDEPSRRFDRDVTL